eukprot:Awhi_evm1s12784
MTNIFLNDDLGGLCSGDVNCTTSSCSNCCRFCNNGNLEVGEECDYIDSVDKYIVAKGSPVGYESGDPNYDFLISTKTCNPTSCQIE